MSTTRRWWSALLVALAGMLAACAAPDPAHESHTLVLPPPADADLTIEPLPVRVHAPAGLVERVDAAEVSDVGPNVDVTDSQAVADPARPSVLFLVWLGGACDDRVDLTILPQDDGLLVTGTTDRGLTMSCAAVGVPRAIEVDLREPADVSRVVFDQGP